MIRLFFFLIFMFPLSAGLCRYHIHQVAQAEGIPPDILSAIAQVESGQYAPHHGRKEAWPWTIYARGQGLFFKTKAQALRYVESLLNAGETNIDIGCMQINWRSHRHKFKSLEDILDPEQNVNYAGHLLKEHYRASQSWDVAIGNYHSKTPEHHARYVKMVNGVQETMKKDRPTTLQKMPHKPWRPPMLKIENTSEVAQNKTDHIQWLK